MSDRTFVDSNILIYAHDADAKSKHAVAKGILQQLWEQRAGVLSMQVLEEFYFNATRKITVPLPKNIARMVVNTYEPWCVETTVAEITAAFQIEDGFHIGFGDALIVASAAKRGAQRILSEYLSAGQIIAGVRIENPFQ